MRGKMTGINTRVTPYRTIVLAAFPYCRSQVLNAQKLNTWYADGEADKVPCNATSKTAVASDCVQPFRSRVREPFNKANDTSRVTITAESTNKKLYVSSQNGRLLCLASEKKHREEQCGCSNSSLAACNAIRQEDKQQERYRFEGSLKP